MKPFKFTLTAVEFLRQKAEDQAMKSYAQALNARQGAATSLEASERALDSARNEWLSDTTAQPCEAHQLQQRARYWQALVRERDQRRITFTKKAEEARVQLDVMLEARQKREVVDSLRARQKSLHAKELSAHEQKILDEMAQHASTQGLLRNV